jgi:flagellar M-ring protein FliF
MPKRLVQLWERFLEFWNRYNRKQKAIVLSSITVVAITIAILAVVLTRPVYSVLVTCQNYDEMSQVTTLLSDNGYAYTVDDATMVVRVKSSSLVNAKMLLATNEIKADGYTYEDALNSSFTTTEGERQKRWQLYLQQEFKEDLESLDKVRNATVRLNLQDSSNSLFNQTNGSSVSVTLDLKDEMDESEAEGIALLLKTEVPNLELKDITIISVDGSVLYSGDSQQAGSYSSLSKQLKYQQQMQNVVASEIRNQILSSGLYNDVKVLVNFDIDWSSLEKVTHEFSVTDGNDQGFLTEAYIEKSTGTSGVGGVPGTASNDEDTSYYIDNGDGTTTKYSLEKYSYNPNEIVTTQTTTPGEIIKENSTASVVMTKNVVYTKSEAEALGYLDELTWDEFKAQNSSPIQTTYDDDWINIISTGAGISTDNITIVAYECHYFMDDDESRPVSFYLQILLALLILALLVFVVLRSTRVVTVEETEPELSVEDMLATTRENMPSVEDIDLQEKSEVRKAIERFVAENPEAVAMLLRNWLDDGWD